METTQTLNTATAFNAYSVKKLAAFKDVELEDGQYLVRKIEKGNGKESQGVIIPAITGEEFVVALEYSQILNGAITWYQEQVANCCKIRIEQGATTLTASDYNIDAISEMLAAQEIKEGRVSKEKIAAWFASDVQTILAQAFKQKLGDSIDDTKLAQVIGSYRDCFALLAKRELMLDDTKKQNLSKALSLLPDSGMKAYCVAKIAGLKAASTEEMLGL